MAQRPSIHTKNAGDGLTIAGVRRRDKGGSLGRHPIDFVFRKRGQLLVRGFLFGEILLQDLGAVRPAQRFRPRDQCPVASHFVVLDRLP